MTQENLGKGFADPAAIDPNALIEALRKQEANGEAAERYEIKYEMLALKPGEYVLDFGCGAGRDLMRMAPLVGRDGSVVGIDINEALVEHTQRRIVDAGLANARALHSVGGRLPFPDASFDVVHTERVLIFVADPDEAVAEMVRVTRPGGRIVCCEFDTVSFLDMDDMGLVQKVYARGGSFSRNPYMGRQLFRRFRRAGLVDVEVRGVLRTNVQQDTIRTPMAADLEKALSEGAITRAEASRFEEHVRALQEAGHLFTASPSFVARGMKPE